MRIDVNSNLQLFNLTFVVGGGIIDSESEGMKMPRFNIEISDNAYYPDIEAETEEAAMYMAVGWWMERNPDIHCEEVQEDA